MSFPKPFSQACENNQGPILDVLRDVMASSQQVLEIGSGTGQHAVYFGRHLTHLTWQTSDLLENHHGIQTWLDEAQLTNVLPPCILDMSQPEWPDAFDAVFTANTLHIMPWHLGKVLLNDVSRLLPAEGLCVIYGPFNYGGQYTSESNREFDVWLKSVDSNRGIRDQELVVEHANEGGLRLVEDIAMPANNRLLVLRKSAA